MVWIGWLWIWQEVFEYFGVVVQDYFVGFWVVELEWCFIDQLVSEIVLVCLWVMVVELVLGFYLQVVVKVGYGMVVVGL